MIETITYDEILETKNSKADSTHTLNRKIYSKIIYYLNKYNCVNVDLITNTHLGIVFQDFGEFSVSFLVPLLNTNGGIYSIGRISNMEIYIDPNKTWMDTTIDIKYNTLFLRRLKINKILDGKEYNVLERIIVDKKLADLIY